MVSVSYRYRKKWYRRPLCWPQEAVVKKKDLSQGEPLSGCHCTSVVLNIWWRSLLHVTRNSRHYCQHFCSGFWLGRQHLVIQLSLNLSGCQPQDKVSFRGSSSCGSIIHETGQKRWQRRLSYEMCLACWPCQTGGQLCEASGHIPVWLDLGWVWCSLFKRSSSQIFKKAGACSNPS